MRDVILSSPDQFSHSIEVNKDVVIDASGIDSIILAGMGGSGHPGDLLDDLHLTTVPLRVHRSYGLPPMYGKKPLIIVSSYSGNTEEALSAYEEAQQKGYPLVVNTSGGTLSEWSQRDNVPWIKIDYPGMQPRHTLHASFAGIVTVLAKNNLSKDISEELHQLADFLKSTVASLDQPGKELADKLKGITPIFTSSDVFRFAAKNFKIQTNENAKTPGFWNEFPELNHNEMVGFTHPQGKFHVVMLQDETDHLRTKARMQVTKDLYESWDVEVSVFALKGNTVLEKLFYAVTFGLWTTFHLAENYGLDPVPVEGVENFKQKLKEIAG